MWHHPKVEKKESGSYREYEKARAKVTAREIERGSSTERQTKREREVDADKTSRREESSKWKGEKEMKI